SATLGYFLLAPHHSRQAQLRRIRVGMSEAEVEGILGCPCGDYTRGPVPAPSENRINQGPAYLCLWYFDDCTIMVQFDNGGSVVGRWREEPIRPPPTFTEGVRAYLGL